MTEEQIKNSINLCKNQPLSKILQLFRFWGPEEVDAMANFFGCPKDEHHVAMHLMMGR